MIAIALPGTAYRDAIILRLKTHEENEKLITQLRMQSDEKHRVRSDHGISEKAETLPQSQKSWRKRSFLPKERGL